jgi:Na+/serine symporter
MLFAAALDIHSKKERMCDSMNPIIWQYVGIFFAALTAILIGLLLWRRRELRRMEAMGAAKIIAPWGFDLLTKLLDAYAVGNYFGRDSVTRVIHEIIDELKGGGLPAMLKKIGWKVVEGVFLKNEDDRKRLQGLLDTTAASVSDLQAPPAAL